MISGELKSVLLKALKLDDWDITDTTLSMEVPGWDSLNHLNIILAVEEHFGVRFTSLDICKLRNVGDLQKLVHASVNRHR